jgi:hypothetical protein
MAQSQLKNQQIRGEDGDAASNAGADRIESGTGSDWPLTPVGSNDSDKGAGLRFCAHDALP